MEIKHVKTNGKTYIIRDFGDNCDIHYVGDDGVLELVREGVKSFQEAKRIAELDSKEEH